MKKAVFLLGLILCMAVCACGKGKNVSSEYKTALQDLFRDKQEIVIDCFGDSITWGQFNSEELDQKIQSGEVTPSLDDGGQLFEDYGIYISSVYQSDPTYPEKLESMLNQKLSETGRASCVRTVNDGISGDWLTKKSYQRITCDPDIVLILYTGNNFYFEQPYKGTLEANVKALRKKGCIVYFLTYPLYPERPYTEDFANANAYLRSVAEKEGVRLIDTYELFEDAVRDQYDRDELFSTDKIHLSELGYELLGLYAAEAIFSDIG